MKLYSLLLFSIFSLYASGQTGYSTAPGSKAFADFDAMLYSASLTGTLPDSPDATRSIPTLVPDPMSGAGPPAIQPVEKNKPETKVHWSSAISEALLSTGIMHTFNLWTEAGTRDTLYGPWLRDYFRSVSELRGWSDSDTFMAPYVGHTIQGSSYGFILRQNDPRYRTVQWGDGRDYFRSVLRSMAFATVWHTQWKIGPVSEASLGSVMLHASPGFITLVATPTAGTVGLMAEDIADRYVITGLENRSTNRVLILLTRCFLNPGRSFANVMAFKVPWSRDTRIGLFRQDWIKRQELVAKYKNGGDEKPFEFIRRPGDGTVKPDS